MANYPARAYLKYEEVKEDILARIQTTRNAAAAGDVNRTRLIRFMGNLTKAIDVFDECAAVPGIVQYARDQFADQGRDVVAEFTAYRAAIESLRNWINTNFPKQGAAWLDNAGYDLYGNQQIAVFTQAQLVSFVAECDTVLAL